MRFGLSVEQLEKATKEGIPVDVTNFLKKDTPAQYLVMNETKDGKTYARIVDGSLKLGEQPSPPQQEVEVTTEIQGEKKEEPQGSPSNNSKLDEIYEAFA